MQPTSPRQQLSEVWRRLVSQDAPELKGRLTAATLLLVAVIGVADFLLGFEISVMVFYFVPVALAVVCRGWRFGVAIAAACVVSWISGDLAAGAHYASRLVPIWNAIIVFLTYLVLIALLAGLLALQRELEVRVARRTAALANEVAERERLEKAVLEISERERRSIGHDLHDSLGQHLTGTALTCQVLAEKLQDRSAPEVTDALKLVGLIKSAIEQTRQMAKGLLLADIDRDGLAMALQEFCADTSRQFHMDCRFHGEGAAVFIEDGVASHLYRIGQEAIRNAVRHSRARIVKVSLQVVGDRIVLRVDDDGIGLPRPETRGSGIGIRIMTHRAQMIGANFAVASRPEGGTRVTCQLPRPKP